MGTFMLTRRGAFLSRDFATTIRRPRGWDYLQLHRVLASTVALIKDDTLRPDMECTQVEYFHLLLDGHQDDFATGIEGAALMPTEVGVNPWPGDARTEICAVIPELVTDLNSFGPHYRMALKPTEIRAMMAL